LLSNTGNGFIHVLIGQRDAHLRRHLKLDLVHNQTIKDLVA
jgi:hypothetical protein